MVLMYVLFLTSCATRPMTKRGHNTYSQVGDVKNFQYYVSRNIVLTMTEDPVVSGQVAVTGKIDVRTVKNIIQITSATKGELL